MSTPDLVAPPRATYVKRRRVGGWRAPEGAVSCTRGKYPSRWGNQFRAGDLLPDGTEVADHEHAVQLYREWLRHQPIEQAAIVHHLAGATLMCWCAEGQPCHVQDVMIPLINEGRVP